MEIVERKIKGVYEIKLQPFIDKRGFFARTFDKNVFVEHGIDRQWVQENHSHNEKKGIIRGLHIQKPPFTEVKLVRCIRGKIFDVILDLRKNSATFGEWDSIELSEFDYTMAYIPTGCAHGFCTLTDQSDVLYKVDNFYSPDHELGILWNDSELNIKWPTEEPLLSEKDKNNLQFNMFLVNYETLFI